MKTLFRVSVCFACILIAISFLEVPLLEAEIQRDRKDEGVVLGKWQPPKPDEKRGYFLDEDKLKPGDALAVKVFLENPGEKVAVTLTIQVPQESDRIVQFPIQDGKKGDLLPKEKAIMLFELIDILDKEEATYLVEVSDKSGHDPVVRIMERSGGVFKSLGRAASNVAKNLLAVPTTIANAILFGGRGLERLNTLIIADAEGKTRDSLTFKKGTIQSPVWLSNEQILFVETQDRKSTLKVVNVDSMQFVRKEVGDFGGKTIQGTYPHLAPDEKSIIFLQDFSIFSMALSKPQPVPLLQDKKVIKILDIFPDADGYNLVFEEKKEIFWLAKIEKTEEKAEEKAEVVSVDRIPDKNHWMLLEHVNMYGQRMAYEILQNINGKGVWNIYLSQSPGEEGKKITSDEYHDRYPSWGPDGTKIVYASGEIVKGK